MATFTDPVRNIRHAAAPSASTKPFNDDARSSGEAREPGRGDTTGKVESDRGVPRPVLKMLEFHR